MSTMVCAGVEGGGTDSCEVRAQRGPCREERGRATGLGFGMGLGFACFGPEKMLGVGLEMEKKSSYSGAAVGVSDGGRIGLGLRWTMWWLV